MRKPDSHQPVFELLSFRNGQIWLRVQGLLRDLGVPRWRQTVYESWEVASDVIIFFLAFLEITLWLDHTCVCSLPNGMWNCPIVLLKCWLNVFTTFWSLIQRMQIYAADTRRVVAIFMQLYAQCHSPHNITIWTTTAIASVRVQTKRSVHLKLRVLV